MNPTIVYCEGAFNTTNGKTAHGLVRFTERFDVVTVIDSRYAGQDAGAVLDGRPNGILLTANLHDALALCQKKDRPAHDFVIGLAPDGGRLPAEARKVILDALEARLDVYSGLHDYLSKDEVIRTKAEKVSRKLTDIRKPPPINSLHFFSGKIDEVKSLRIAVLGTDSAIGKRTTAWKLVHGFREAGHTAELVGTGQTAWLQGAKHGIVMDSLVNDFVSGEIEHAVHETWLDTHPEVIVLEGQGSLLNPAYPGGFELLAAGRPHIVILQHAPRRLEYDGFPGFPLHPLSHQIMAIEVISGKKVSAITLNHEGMKPTEIVGECRKIKEQIGIPAYDVLEHGPQALVNLLKPNLKKRHG
ncbi:MAG: DUF1611 domain-containing protein [Bacteroidales bacterium]